MPSLLEIEDLRLDAGGRELVRGIDLAIDAGEWFALIGESGSGKSLTAASVIDLLPRGVRRRAGGLRLAGTDLLTLDASGLRQLRGRRVSYVFQDYNGAFTPFHTLGNAMDEVLRCHTDWGRRTRRARCDEVLALVGLPVGLLTRYPCQVSGGQLQRMALAAAILLEPEVLIADEPTTALDAVSAAQVLSCINDLRTSLGCAVLFITHDLRTVRRHADTVAIMRAGRIVETGTASVVLAAPKAAYTRSLLGAIPPLKHVPRRLPVLSEAELGEAS